MKKRSQEYLAERLGYEQRAKALHDTLLQADSFPTTEFITFKYVRPLPFGPEFIRQRFPQPYELTTEASVCVLGKDNDGPTVLMIHQSINSDVVAVRKTVKRHGEPAKTQFETFSFQLSGSDDYHLVKDALNHWKEASTSVQSIKEYVEQLKPKPLQGD